MSTTLTDIAKNIRDAMAAYDGLAVKEKQAKVLEIGRLLKQARRLHPKGFDQWCLSEGLTVGIFADRRERAATLQIVNLMASCKSLSLDECRLTGPNDMLDWLRSQLPPPIMWATETPRLDRSVIQPAD